MRKLKMQSKPDSHQNLKLSEKIGKKNMKKKKRKKKKRRSMKCKDPPLQISY